MELIDVGKTGKYKTISNTAIYIYSPEEVKFLNSLTDAAIKQELLHKGNVYRKSLSDYHYKYWLNTCETILFGNSNIDCSTIDLETRKVYWRNYPNLNYSQKREIENFDIKVHYEKVANLNGYFKDSIEDMFYLFSLLYYREDEYYKSLGRSPKFVSVEEFESNYKNTKVLNLKWRDIAYENKNLF